MNVTVVTSELGYTMLSPVAIAPSLPLLDPFPPRVTPRILQNREEQNANKAFTYAHVEL